MVQSGRTHKRRWAENQKWAIYAGVGYQYWGTDQELSYNIGLKFQFCLTWRIIFFDKHHALPRSIIRTFGFAMLFCAMFAIAGGHLIVLQSVAWTKMLIEYSQKSGLVDGVAMTFNGSAPCKLCKAVDAGQRDQSKIPQSFKTDKKIEGLAVDLAFVVKTPVPQDFSYPHPSDETPSSRSQEPPQPVPILALG